MASAGEVAHPEATARLMQYWAEGAGSARILWGTPGSFERCRVELGNYVPDRMLDGLCANLFHRATGTWPGAHGGQHGK